MKYLGRSFSIPMPGNKVTWPFARRRLEDTQTANCPHPAVRRTLVGRIFMCRDCKDVHDGKVVSLPEAVAKVFA
jgi:ribosomal protein L37AE/L43A